MLIGRGLLPVSPGPSPRVSLELVHSGASAASKAHEPKAGRSAFAQYPKEVVFQKAGKPTVDAAGREKTDPSFIKPVRVQDLYEHNKFYMLYEDIVSSVFRWWTIGYLKVVLLWFVWMGTGTAFYAVRNGLGWAKGFYMMINVGYSIGWGYPTEVDRRGLWFSVFNVFVGATAISYGLRLFAQSVLSESKSWYAIALYERTMADMSVSRTTKMIEYTKTHSKKLLTISVFIIWVMAMVWWSSRTFQKWKIVQGVYFAVSSLSTGGMFPIPEGASDESYITVGVFSAIGIPLMGLAMANCTRLLLKFGDPEKAKELIQAKVSKEELETMTKFGLDDGRGIFTQTEFIILSMMRLRVLTPGAIEEINSRFNFLDEDGCGKISIDSIIGDSKVAQSGHVVHPAIGMQDDIEAIERGVGRRKLVDNDEQGVS